MSRVDIRQEEYRALEKRGYEVVRLLGEGAFSRVFLVQERLKQMPSSVPAPGRAAPGDSDEGKYRREQSRISIGYLACKICSQVKLGLWEGELLQRMDHPLFPRFFGMWQEEGRVFLLTEAVCGSSLEAILGHRGAFTERQTARMGLELAAGLKYLHELPEPMLFRDVKPANIMIRQDGRVKLLDLGCACRLGERPRDLAGTPGYGAPEQMEPGHMLTTACDVYGLGRTLQTTAGENCGKAFTRALRACTVQQPEVRPQDMREVITVLTPFVGEGRSSRVQRRKLPHSGNICVKNIWESNYKNT